MFGQLKLSVCRTALASNQALVEPLKQLHVIVLAGLFEIKSAELYLFTRVFTSDFERSFLDLPHPRW